MLIMICITVLGRLVTRPMESDIETLCSYRLLFLNLINQTIIFQRKIQCDRLEWKRVPMHLSMRRLYLTQYSMFNNNTLVYGCLLAHAERTWKNVYAFLTSTGYQTLNFNDRGWYMVSCTQRDTRCVLVCACREREHAPMVLAFLALTRTKCSTITLNIHSVP